MRPLVVIAGPTACGKTEISVQLAKKLSAEIISADSMQIYKYMDIGTAKPLPKELDGIKHYLIDELYPNEEYSAAVFQRMAKTALEEIYMKDNLPILVGGTGFYINALIKDNAFTQHKEDGDARQYFEGLLQEKGAEYLRSLLAQVDPESFETIHPNNMKRTLRALEFFKQSGEKMSEHNKKEKEKTYAYDVTFIVLTMQRDILYKRINERVDAMLMSGLENEVRELIGRGYRRDSVAMQGIGYKEMTNYIAGVWDYAAAVEAIKQTTRNFAKRQLTWFKHQTDGIWIDRTEMNTEEAVEKIEEEIRKRK